LKLMCLWTIRKGNVWENEKAGKQTCECLIFLMEGIFSRVTAFFYTRFLN
jgi:hypothetical protein